MNHVTDVSRKAFHKYIVVAHHEEPISYTSIQVKRKKRVGNIAYNIKLHQNCTYNKSRNMSKPLISFSSKRTALFDSNFGRTVSEILYAV